VKVELEIKSGHEPIWERAEAYCQAVGVSLATFVTVAVEQRLGSERRHTHPKLRSKSEDR
jgi:hypothetical protein